MGDILDRHAEAERLSRLDQVEAESRAAEARAAFFRNRVRREGPESPLAGRLAETTERYRELNEEAQELRSMGPIKDPEGTAPTLADYSGNFAPNQEVANAGGTGVQSSNSTSDGSQAQSAEEALDGATVIRPAGFSEPVVDTLDGKKAVRAMQNGGDAAGAVNDEDDEEEATPTPRRGRRGRKARTARQEAADEE